MTLEFVSRVLHFVDMLNDYGDMSESIIWRTDGEYAPVTFFVLCNDLFYWATADLEQITPENVDALEQAILDVRRAFGVENLSRKDDSTVPDYWVRFEKWYSAGSRGALLFCARMRKMRPQKPWFDRCAPDELVPLFEACGPERLDG